MSNNTRKTVTVTNIDELIAGLNGKAQPAPKAKQPVDTTAHKIRVAAGVLGTTPELVAQFMGVEAPAPKPVSEKSEAFKGKLQQWAQRSTDNKALAAALRSGLNIKDIRPVWDVAKALQARGLDNASIVAAIKSAQ
jgi:hypothetical protein